MKPEAKARSSVLRRSAQRRIGRHFTVRDEVVQRAKSILQFLQASGEPRKLASIGAALSAGFLCKETTPALGWDGSVGVVRLKIK
jgi:hypothetical protein